MLRNIGRSSSIGSAMVPRRPNLAVTRTKAAQCRLLLRWTDMDDK